MIINYNCWLNSKEMSKITNLKRLKHLQTLALRIDQNITGFRRSLISVNAWIVALGWQAFTGRSIELELASISGSQLIFARVEVQGACQCHSSNQL